MWTQAELASRRAAVALAGAERAGDQRARRDHQPDIDGGGEEQDDRGEAHAGGEAGSPSQEM